MARAPGSNIPFAPVATLIRLVVANGGVHLRRIPALSAYLLRYLLLEPFRLLDRLVHGRRIASHVLSEPPVFILGHWRSGTSYLQTLLREDPRLETSTVFRSFFADNFLVTESWLKPILTLVARAAGLRFHIQRVPLEWDLPAEGDVGLCSLSSEYSYTWGQLFPTRFERWFKRLILLPEEEVAERWLQDYDHFLRKLSYRSGGKRLLIKSPGDTARVAQLLKQYPDARFVYIHRDPIAVFHSNRYLWEVIQGQHGFQCISDAERDEIIVSHYADLLESYLEHRAVVPSSQLVEIRYEDLKEAPLETLEGVYQTLGLGELPREAISSFTRKQRPYQARDYVTSPELEASLKKRWGFAFDHWSSRPGE